MSAKYTSPARRLLKLFSFSPRVKILVIGITILFVLLGFCWGFLLLLIAGADATSTTMSNWEATLVIWSFFVLPFFSLLMVLATLFEKRHPPRTILWSVVMILIVFAGVLISVFMAYDAEVQMGLVFMLTTPLPLALLFSMPALYSLIHTFSEVRAVLRDDLNDRMLAYIGTRGAVRFAELSSVMGIPLTEVDDLADELLRSGRLAGSMDVANQWVYTAAYLAERQRLLLEWVQLRGRIHLDELARLLKASTEVVTDWIYQLVQREQFDAYVNWSHGWIYAATAGEIGSNSQCPQCGGQLSPGPAGSIRCLYCGTEGFHS